MADVGDLIADRYRLLAQIAVGGMGVVWEGRDEVLTRRVAIKQVRIQPGLSEADALLARNRVIREARITARLHHPHAVTIYDVVDDGDYPCLIMQFVLSTSLNGLLRDQGTLGQSQVGRIGADLASALQAAHQVGIVHRDVKPGNVLITDDGSAKLTDFGISHAFGDVTLTSTGMVSGTPAYLAPEVARGGTSGFPADVFSLGATLYASLEGAPPFGLDANPMAVLHRVASGQVTPPQRSGALTPLLMAMLAPEPGDRPTMAEVSQTLTLPIIAPAPAAPPVGPLDKAAERTVPVSRPDLAAASGVGLSGAPTRAAAADTPATRTAVSSAEELGSAGLGSAGSGPAQPVPAGNRATPEAQRPGGLDALLDGSPTSAARPATPGRRRTALLAVVAAVVLVAALTAGFFLVNGQEGGEGSVAATSAQVSPAPSPEPAAPPAGGESSPGPDPTTSAESTAGSSTPDSSSADSSSAVASSAAVSSAADPGAELTAAVTDYYALMPGDTEAGWTRLTPNFQSGVAQDREYYDRFWGGVSSVVAGDVVATGPDTVEATITYTFADGSQSVERTAYTLVRDGAEIKIDNSTVLS